MKRRHILCLVGLILSAAVTVLALAPAERAVQDHSGWMAMLPDETQLTGMTIPGTHDSGALYSFAGVSGQCQSATVGQQLKMGVRFLDIRLQLDHDELKVVHSFVDQKQTFREVLDTIALFIRENPSEFLLLSLKEDNSPKDSSVPFSVRLEEMLSGYTDVIVPDSGLPEHLGDARGKIFLLSRYDNASVGIPAYHGWKDSAAFALGSMYIQDHYEISEISAKQNDILAALEEAALSEEMLLMNFTSCYFDHGFPPMSAAAPARTINPWLAEFCRNAEFCRGIFICDYMTSELASVLLERNFS